MFEISKFEMILGYETRRHYEPIIEALRYGRQLLGAYFNQRPQINPNMIEAGV